MIKKLKKHVLININNVLSGKSCDVHVFSIYNTWHCLPLFKRNIDSFAFVRGNPSKFVRHISYLLKEKAMLCPVYLRHIFVINYCCIILHKATLLKIFTLCWFYLLLRTFCLFKEIPSRISYLKSVVVYSKFYTDRNFKARPEKFIFVIYCPAQS